MLPTQTLEKSRYVSRSAGDPHVFRDLGLLGAASHLSDDYTLRSAARRIQAEPREEGLELHEFVIMRDHFHGLVTPAPEHTIEKAIQFLKGGFSFRATQELNVNFEVWQKGFMQHRIRDADDYQKHLEYIWMNPVRARYVERAEDYHYSSARLRELVDPAPVWVKAARTGS